MHLSKGEFDTWADHSVTQIPGCVSGGACQSEAGAFSHIDSPLNLPHVLASRALGLGHYLCVLLTSLSGPYFSKSRSTLGSPPHLP